MVILPLCHPQHHFGCEKSLVKWVDKHFRSNKNFRRVSQINSKIKLSLLDAGSEDAEQMTWLVGFGFSFHIDSPATFATHIAQGFTEPSVERSKKNQGKFSLLPFLIKHHGKKPKLLISLSLPKRLNSVYTEAVGRDWKRVSALLLQMVQSELCVEAPESDATWWKC